MKTWTYIRIDGAGTFPSLIHFMVQLRKIRGQEWEKIAEEALVCEMLETESITHLIWKNANFIADHIQQSGILQTTTQEVFQDTKIYYTIGKLIIYFVISNVPTINRNNTHSVKTERENSEHKTTTNTSLEKHISTNSQP